MEQLYDENNSIWSRFGCETIENVYKSSCKRMLQYEELKDIYHEILVCNKCNKIFFITDIFKTVFSINCSNLSCVAFINSFVLSIESNASLFLQPEQCRISFQCFCPQYVYIDLKIFTDTICEEDGFFLKKCVCIIFVPSFTNLSRDSN